MSKRAWSLPARIDSTLQLPTLAMSELAAVPHLRDEGRRQGPEEGKRTARARKGKLALAAGAAALTIACVGCSGDSPSKNLTRTEGVGRSAGPQPGSEINGRDASLRVEINETTPSRFCDAINKSIKGTEFAGLNYEETRSRGVYYDVDIGMRRVWCQIQSEAGTSIQVLAGKYDKPKSERDYYEDALQGPRLRGCHTAKEELVGGDSETFFCSKAGPPGSEGSRQEGDSIITFGDDYILGIDIIGSSELAVTREIFIKVRNRILKELYS